MRRYALEYEDSNGRHHRTEGDHEYIDGCYDQAGELFDKGVEEDFRIVELEDGVPCGVIRLPAHKLVKQPCPICGKDVRSHEMMQTSDCHGIPYRYVCPKCYEKKMYGNPGYDGEYYTEADECF